MEKKKKILQNDSNQHTGTDKTGLKESEETEKVET